jgi:nucleoside-diphosphate-sugar epimerase
VPPASPRSTSSSTCSPPGATWSGWTVSRCPPHRAFAALPGRFTLIGGSILSAADLRRALTIAPIEAVIHCAVITAGSAREKSDPETIVAVNI